MSERAMSARVRLERIKRYALAEDEQERLDARKAAAESAYPDLGFQVYETPIASPAEPIEHQW